MLMLLSILTSKEVVSLMNFVVPWKLFVATRQPGPVGLLGLPEHPAGRTLGSGIFARIAVAIGLIRVGSMTFGTPLKANGARHVPSAFGVVGPTGQLGSLGFGR